MAPKVFGHSLRINPLLVIFALLLGGHLQGILGALLALPVAAIIREPCSTWRAPGDGTLGDPVRCLLRASITEEPSLQEPRWSNWAVRLGRTVRSG